MVGGESKPKTVRSQGGAATLGESEKPFLHRGRPLGYSKIVPRRLSPRVQTDAEKIT